MFGFSPAIFSSDNTVKCLQLAPVFQRLLETDAPSSGGVPVHLDFGQTSTQKNVPGKNALLIYIPTTMNYSIQWKRNVLRHFTSYRPGKCLKTKTLRFQRIKSTISRKYLAELLDGERYPLNASRGVDQGDKDHDDEFVRQEFRGRKSWRF